MLRPIQPYVEYFINQDYIAEFLCINKDKPKMQCNGKCYLVKELEKQQESNPLTSLKVSLENYPIGFVNIVNIPKATQSLHKQKHLFFYSNLYAFDTESSMFHPPNLV